MRIGTDGDVSRRIALTQWQAQIDGQHTAVHRLASGLRINSAVDDAAGLAIAERMNAQIFGAAQGQRNAQDGINMLQMADGALEESVAVVQRLRVIAVQAANGSWTDAQRAALQAMVEQGLAGLDDLASRTTWNGIHLLDGSQADLRLQIGASDGAHLTVDLDGARAADLGLSGATASAASASAAAAISVATRDSAQEAIGRLDGALEILLEHRADLGASASRLEHAVEALGVQELNLVAARSRLTDVDVAGETVKLAKIKAVSDLCAELVRKAMLGQHAAVMLLLAAAWRPR